MDVNLFGSIRLASLLAACAIATGCAHDGAPRPAATLPPIAIHGNIQTFEIAPVLLAADAHYPGHYPGGATVKMGGIPNLFGEAAIPGYGSPGVADVATHAETQALRYSVAHPDLRVILTVSEGFYRIVARRSAGITKLADLRGKRIAAVANTSSGYFLNRMLASAGMTEADVTLVPISPLSAMPKALADGTVDVVTVWEPEVENAAAAIGDDAIQFSDSHVYREIFGLNTTAANLADPEKRRRIVAFVRSVIAASTALRADPAGAQALVSKSSGYDIGLVERAWHHQGYPATLVPDLLDTMVEEEKWLAALDKRPARDRATLATLIDGSVLEEARKP